MLFYSLRLTNRIFLGGIGISYSLEGLVRSRRLLLWPSCRQRLQWHVAIPDLLGRLLLLWGKALGQRLAVSLYVGVELLLRLLPLQLLTRLPLLLLDLPLLPPLIHLRIRTIHIQRLLRPKAPAHLTRRVPRHRRHRRPLVVIRRAAGAAAGAEEPEGARGEGEDRREPGRCVHVGA